jgi:SPP1 family predicted phage head-tail adaptor
MPDDIGKLRQRIDIQTQTEAKDAYGQDVPTWTTAATRWASIEPLSGRELWQAQQIHPDVTHRITIRYYPGLNPRHRFHYALPVDRYFNILSILTRDEVHSVSNFMDVMCVEELKT